MDIDSYQLRLVLDCAPVGISLVTIDRTVKYCNPAYAEIYGWKVEELIGKRLPIPEHQEENWNELLNQLRMGQNFRNVETIRVRKDGTEFYARISGTPVFDGAGNLDGLVAFVTDTEDNHSDQLEIRSLEYLVQSATDFMCVADLSMKVIFVNDPGRRMVGLGRDEDVDRFVSFDLFANDSRDRIEAAASSLILTGASVALQLDLKHVVTGASIPVSCSVYLMRDPHSMEPASFTFVAHSLADVRQLERQADHSERAFNSLFNSVPVAIALVNPSEYLVDCNERFQALLGYSAGELTNKSLATVVHPDDLKAGRGLFLDLIAGKIENYQTIKRLINKEGKPVQVRMTVSLVRGPQGEAKHSISIVQRLSGESFQQVLRSPSDPAGGFPGSTLENAGIGLPQ